MNDIQANNSDDYLTYQTERLRGLIKEIVECCDVRKLFESRKFGLPYAELKCLMLFNGGRYLTVKSIAKNLDVAKSRVTKIVAGLTDKGLVDSIDDPKDARVRLISLTVAGRQKFNEIDLFQRDIHRGILEHFTADEREVLMSRLDSLRSVMESVKSKLT